MKPPRERQGHAEQGSAPPVSAAKTRPSWRSCLAGPDPRPRGRWRAGTLASACVDIDKGPPEAGAASRSWRASPARTPSYRSTTRPALLALADTLQQRDAEERATRHGATWQVLTRDVLPRFSPVQRPAAAPVPEAGPMPGDALVLTGRPLRPEALVEQTSRLTDDIRVLDPAWLRADRRPMTLNFTGLPQPEARSCVTVRRGLLRVPAQIGQRRTR